MTSLGKTIARRPWLLPLLAVIFLVQMQQAVACGLMKMPASTPDGHCATHQQGARDDSQAPTQFCFENVISNTAGHPCHWDKEMSASSSVPGKLQPDWQPALIVISRLDTLGYSSPPLLTISPEREFTRPGTSTYLTTLRLRI